MPTTDELQTQINSLTSRLTALDGVGLSAPQVGTIPTMQRDITGLRSTIKQSVLKMEQLYNDLSTLVSSYITLVRQKFN
jgi:uncharacterized coiled-coil protein SlyX